MLASHGQTKTGSRLKLSWVELSWVGHSELGFRDNVRCSSWDHWKGRSGLLISVNWTFSWGITAEALRAKIHRKSAISLQRGQFDTKFQVEGVAPYQSFSHEQLGQWMPYNFVAYSYHPKKLCSRLSSSEVRFYTEIGRFAFCKKKEYVFVCRDMLWKFLIDAWDFPTAYKFPTSPTPMHLNWNIIILLGLMVTHTEREAECFLGLCVLNTVCSSVLKAIVWVAESAIHRVGRTNVNIDENLANALTAAYCTMLSSKHYNYTCGRRWCLLFRATTRPRVSDLT